MIHRKNRTQSILVKLVMIVFQTDLAIPLSSEPHWFNNKAVINDIAHILTNNCQLIDLTLQEILYYYSSFTQTKQSYLVYYFNIHLPVTF